MSAWARLLLLLFSSLSMVGGAGWLAGCSSTRPMAPSYYSVRYIGDVRDGQRHGFGTYRWYTGRTYRGEWKKGKPDGHGTYSWPDGSAFEGEFRNGLANGPGTFYWPDGRRLEAEFRDGKANGRGTLYWPSGEKREGEWRDGYRLGDRDATSETRPAAAATEVSRSS